MTSWTCSLVSKILKARNSIHKKGWFSLSAPWKENYFIHCSKTSIFGHKIQLCSNVCYLRHLFVSLKHPIEPFEIFVEYLSKFFAYSRHKLVSKLSFGLISENFDKRHLEFEVQKSHTISKQTLFGENRKLANGKVPTFRLLARKFIIWQVSNFWTKIWLLSQCVLCTVTDKQLKISI